MRLRWIVQDDIKTRPSPFRAPIYTRAGRPEYVMEMDEGDLVIYETAGVVALLVIYLMAVTIGLLL